MSHPARTTFAEVRSASVQNRIADWVTEFAGSMIFVYVHIAWFALWIALRVEPFPFGLLTMIVSLEAIFLSTFVMISQNRADARHDAFADHQWKLIQKEDEQNQRLLQLTQRIHDLTQQIHGLQEQSVEHTRVLTDHLARRPGQG